ncbi:MAG: YutD family protein [Aerococcus sp.]|nr:YutD family protein [Aerococcus sp.]
MTTEKTDGMTDKYSKAHVLMIDSEHINIENQQFVVIAKTNDDALSINALALRYVPLFDVYDYLVGDWSGGQLRLKGFYEGNQPDTPIDRDIRYLEDYLTEYCSFGCDYFVLKHERDTDERIAQSESIKEKNKTKTHKHKNYNKKKKKKHTRAQGKTKFKYRDKHADDYQKKYYKGKKQKRQVKDYTKHQAFKIH